MFRHRDPSTYTRAEYWSDGAVHGIGIVAALIAVPALIVLAVTRGGDPGTITAATIYGVTVILMLTCSAIYNMVRSEAWRPLLRRIDQSAIYFKIAGTYTPFAVFAGLHSGPFLAGVWGAAGLGAGLVSFGKRHPFVKWTALALYLGIGWAGAFYGGPLIGGLSATGFILLLAGGIVYSAGVLFLLWERLPYHNTIWHVFVLAGTVLCYAAIAVELYLRGAA